MLRLKIDGTLCPIADKHLSLPRYSASKLKNAEGWREGTKLSLGVLSTPETDRLFHFATNIHRGEVFNNTYHSVSIEADGVTLYEGVVTLDAVEHASSGNIYRITIRSGGAEWADTAALTRLNKSSIVAKSSMTLSGIETSWRNNSALRMLPLRRDSYPEDAQTGQYAPQRTWMPHDYHPFISVSEILKSITGANGYTLQSNFLSSELIEKLYISGAYPYIEVAAAQNAMGFKALRSTSTTATAGEDGRVYAWEPVFASNIGALVDTVNPAAVDENGRTMSEAYSNGGCFTFQNGRPVFTPKRDISVAFDIHLRYTTDFSILSSSRLKGFDTIHLSPDCYLKVELQNNYVNHRYNVEGGKSYKLFIFDFDPEDRYSLVDSGTVTSAISTVRMTAGGSGEAVLYVSKKGEGELTPYTGDWAMYDMHVTGEGEREVEVTIRTPFMVYTPSSPMLFNDIFFGGAKSGQRLTLKAGCSITPIFSGAPGYGQDIDFEDIANIDISQMEFLEAIAHLFNLRIYSHRPTKRLYIEPYDDFFSGSVVDWRARQLQEESVMREGVVESFEHTTLGYKQVDGVAARIVDSDSEFGSWSKHISSYGARNGVQTLRNPLFMPTASLNGASGTAPSAEVLTIGDRDTIAADDAVEPRIVLYHGVVPLPNGELWGSPTGERGYPLAAFHSEAMGETLCFEDRDGCEGLHRYYDRELEEQATRGELTCSIYLSPQEYISLFSPEGEWATIRSRFRLQVEGNSSLFRLEAIEEYDPESMIARCLFRQLLED